MVGAENGQVWIPIKFRYLALQSFYLSPEELTIKLGHNLDKPGDFSQHTSFVYPAGSAALGCH